MIFEHKRSNDFHRTLKKAVLKKFWLVFRLTNNKRISVLLKVIQRIYDKISEMQEEMEASILEFWAEEGVSSEQTLFISLFLCCFLYYNGYSSRKNLYKGLEGIQNSLWKV